MSFTRRQAIAATAGTLFSNAFSRQRARPNILFIMTDDHSYTELSCAGNHILKTPNMDRLANEGVRFTNCLCTNSLCAPSRASVLTGCYSHVHGVRGNSEMSNVVEHMNPSLPTFPQLLQKAGYHTGIVGKWHLSDKPVGFDSWCVLPGQGVYFDPEFIDNGTRKTFPGYVTDIITDLAIEFLEKAGPEPFCLLFQHKAPHRPFKPAPRHAMLFDTIEIPHPATYDDNYATRRIAKEAEDMRFDVSLAADYKDLPAGISAAEKKNWIFQRFVKDHYRAVYGVDDNLGRVLQYLDYRKLVDNTLIVYTTDNGFFLGEHGWYDKRFMYEPSLHLPLLIRYPRLGISGQVENRMVLNVDYAPTILDFAGVPVPGSMQGRSLRPLLEGKIPSDWRTSAYYAYYENSWAEQRSSKVKMTDPSFQYFTAHRVVPHRGVRTERYKLIQYYGEGEYWEMFDLEKDPYELNNLYRDSAYKPATEELKRKLQRLKRYYHDNG